MPFSFPAASPTAAAVARARHRLAWPCLALAAALLLGHPGAQAQTQPPPPEIDQRFVASKNCLSCHSAKRKIVGPAFKDIAAKYADHPEAAAHLAEKIRKGGSGVWGPVPMPANPKVNEAEAKLLADWVLATPQ